MACFRFFHAELSLIPVDITLCMNNEKSAPRSFFPQLFDRSYLCFGVVCGGLRWFVVFCGGLWWFVVFSATQIIAN